MTRLQRAFSRKAFIPFITAGDPTLDATEALFLALEDAGADLIELGVPFSDPVAEGPTIQAADERALAAGFTLDRLFALVQRLRRRSDTAIALMTYLNPVFVYGAERFLARCAEVGVDALIVPDMPHEERGELAPHCERFGVALVPLIAPTSGERIGDIARTACAPGAVPGFVYCVSSLGVTGARSAISDAARGMIARAKAACDAPCAVGFGVSTPEQAREIAAFADGVIVGSAIVRIVERAGADAVEEVRAFARGIRGAIDGV